MTVKNDRPVGDTASIYTAAYVDQHPSPQKPSRHQHASTFGTDRLAGANPEFGALNPQVAQVSSDAPRYSLNDLERQERAKLRQPETFSRAQMARIAMGKYLVVY